MKPQISKSIFSSSSSRIPRGNSGIRQSLSTLGFRSGNMNSDAVQIEHTQPYNEERNKISLRTFSIMSNLAII